VVTLPPIPPPQNFIHLPLSHTCHILEKYTVTQKGAVLQIGRSLVRSQMASLEFYIDIKSFRSHYGPEVDSASNRTEYPEYFLGVKAAGAYS